MKRVANLDQIIRSDGPNQIKKVMIGTEGIALADCTREKAKPMDPN